MGIRAKSHRLNCKVIAKMLQKRLSSEQDGIAGS
jgi:hypothetical protein